MRYCIYIFSSLFFSFSAIAQEQQVQAHAETSGSGNIYLNLLLLAVGLLAVILLVVSLVLLNAFKRVSEELQNPRPFSTESKKMLEYEEWAAIRKTKPNIWTKILGLKPVEEEKDLLMEHQFDGISELDNPTPAWFMWLFYGTIAIGVAYFSYYHIAEWGPLQEQEYIAEMDEAKAAKEAYLATAANKIDENSVTEAKDAATLAAGQAIFTSNCVACHGDKAQGIVGPNLTDEYWLHGGKINNVFKTIKYGVPEKGMISWEKTLTPKQISDVANYIKSLKGSNPANPKAPQGEKEG